MTDKVILKADFSDGRIVRREIICEVESIGHKEFFAASQQGLKPEYKLTVWADEYQGESIVIYNGETYKIYRNFRRNADRMELYITRKAGVK